MKLCRFADAMSFYEVTMPFLEHFVVWIIIGLIGGGLAGSLIARRRRGFGLVGNLALGLAGALVGGLLFRWLGLLPELDRISISLRDVVAALVGSLLVLVARLLWQWFRERPKGQKRYDMS